GQQSDIDLNEFLQNIGDPTTEDDDDLQPVSFVWEQVGNDVFLPFFNPEFADGGALAEGATSIIPFLADNPFGAGGASLTAVYLVTPTSGGSLNCEGDPFLVTVIVNPSFQASIGQNGDNTLCYGESRTLNALPNSGNDYTYEWSIVSGGGTIDPEEGNTTSISYTAPESGAGGTVDIQVIVTEVATNCVEIATVTFTLEELPVVVENASLEECETEVGGGEASFDLTDDVVTTTTDVTVTHHENESDAILGVQAIDPADDYVSGSATIFARLSKGEGVSIGTLDLVVNPKPVLEVVATHAACSEQLGSAVVTVTNPGTDTYTYALTGGETNADGIFDDLPPNADGEMYEVTVTNDETDCDNTITFTITEPAEVVTMATQVNVGCFREATGSITVSSTGGDGNYTYTIDPPATFDEATNTFTGLTAGTYSISTEDGNECEGNAPIMVTITQPDDPLFIDPETTQLTNATCFGAADGTIFPTVTGGTVPYTYAWTTQDGTIPAGLESVPVLVGVTAGTYNLKVTDMNGCMTDADFRVDEPMEIMVAVTAQTDPTCNGEATGSVTLGVTGGNAGAMFTYSIDPPAGNIDDQAGTISDLPAGTYTVTAAEVGNATCVGSVEITITEPDPVTASVVDQTDVLCFGEATGSVTLMGAGGNGTYEFSISDGDEDDTNDPTVTDNVISGLSAGTYTVLVTDGNGCAGPAEGITVTITENPEIEITAQTVTNVTCAGDEDGSISISVGGGVPGYMYAWTAEGDATVPPGQDDEQDLTGLGAGTYNLVVTDDEGCTKMFSFTVMEGAEVMATAAMLMDCEAEQGEGEALFDLTSADIMATAGTTISYYTSEGDAVLGINAIPGTDEDAYVSGSATIFVRVESSEGCVAFTTIELVVKPLPALTIEGGDFLCSDEEGIILFATVNGEEADGGTFTITPDDAFVINDGDGALLIDAISPAGTYTIKYVSEAIDGCVDSVSIDFTIQEAPAPMITATETSGTTDDDGTICSGDMVTLTASVRDGFPDAQDVVFTWSTGETGASIMVSPTETTTYTVTASCCGGLDNDCDGDIDFTVIVNDPPVAEITNLPASICLNDESIILEGSPAGGSFSGNGIIVSSSDQCPPAIWINEFHYDNSGGDVGEGVEIAGTAGYDLTEVTVALYNGSSSQRNVYATITFSGTIPDEGNGYGAVFVARADIQNGPPDGLALVDDGDVVEFISYEGSFTAVSGPAKDMTSVDIGVS
ncbi:MAG: SprB repeat-containing protein, partial [Bacteroidota bacterium]